MYFNNRGSMIEQTSSSASKYLKKKKKTLQFHQKFDYMQILDAVEY